MGSEYILGRNMFLRNEQTIKKYKKSEKKLWLLLPFVLVLALGLKATFGIEFKVGIGLGVVISGWLLLISIAYLAHRHKVISLRTGYYFKHESKVKFYLILGITYFFIFLMLAIPFLLYYISN
ncbi:hypothetical protein [Kangiella spongicola]|uniref:Uncharacterized protein n=1 Tax=Kangiella spongicola TaxID=796379 RepID=A0A318D8I0_9GAMM|nr:hypothetical protein [Kangiella spongicola]PXF63167.1 hypothetical protein DL796_06890 [Kangiella spongicola]